MSDTEYLIRLNTGKVHRIGCPLASSLSVEFGPWNPDRPIDRAAANSSCSYCLKTGLPSVGEQSRSLSETRAALRREIGEPSPNDDQWNPMISATELRRLLDVLDQIEQLVRDPLPSDYAIVGDIEKLLEVDGG